MARIIASQYELSGKLGGSVFARNKGGAYARVYTIPINPRSEGQLNVRNGWASAVTSYHALSDVDKAQWNLFAATDFKPKYPKIGVQYSGFNAYVSCKNELIQCTRVQQEAIIGGCTYTYDPFTPTLTKPPEQPMSAAITFGTPGPSPGTVTSSIRLVNASVNTTTNVINLTFKFDFNLYSTFIPKFYDAISQTKCGIVVMQSYPSVQKNLFTINPKYSFATVIPHPVISDTTLTGDEITFTAPFFAGNKKFKPISGDIIELNAFLTSFKGLTQPIGSVKVICS